eukprot:976386-Amphidinium_carterae.1
MSHLRFLFNCKLHQPACKNRVHGHTSSNTNRLVLVLNVSNSFLAKPVLTPRRRVAQKIGLCWLAAYPDGAWRESKGKGTVASCLRSML